MELGIGLPTRDIASKASFGSLPTALEKRDEGRTSAVTYGELIGSGIERSDHFSWLWRSQLSDYHRHSRLLQRWIGQVAETWDDLQKKRAPEWLSGFTIYDKLEDKREHDGTSEHLLKWSEFKELCEQLRKQLEIASESAPSSDI